MLRRNRTALKIAIFTVLLAVIGLVMWVFFSREPEGRPDYGLLIESTWTSARLGNI
jgi:hypothetical protein